MTVGGNDALVIDIKPRQNSKPECFQCGKRGKTYDTQPVAETSSSDIIYKKRVFRELVEAPRVEESAVLMDFQQEVRDVPVTVGLRFSRLILLLIPSEIAEVILRTKKFSSRSQGTNFSLAS